MMFMPSLEARPTKQGRLLKSDIEFVPKSIHELENVLINTQANIQKKGVIECKITVKVVLLFLLTLL